MLSEAGRSYDKTRVVSPYRTRQRFRYYQLPPVQAARPSPKLYQTLDTNLREKQDSFLLRYAKEMTINTNHSPNYDIVKQNSPRQGFCRGAVVRYIGEIRDEDYSKPLMENCDHRCAKANGVEVEHSHREEGGEEGSNHGLHEGRGQELPLKCLQSEKNASLTTIAPLDFSGKLPLSDIRSTEHSLIKKRSKIPLMNPQRPAQKLVQRPLRHRGVSFDSSIGHQYLNDVQTREHYPQGYDLQHSNQSLIRRSMKQPSIHVKFPLFRNSIATRYDRPDPHWHLSMDSSDKSIPQKDMSYDFGQYSARKPNEVYSKYPFRQNMNLYMLPPPGTVKE